MCVLKHTHTRPPLVEWVQGSLSQAEGRGLCKFVWSITEFGLLQRGVVSSWKGTAHFFAHTRTIESYFKHLCVLMVGCKYEICHVRHAMNPSGLMATITATQLNSITSVSADVSYIDTLSYVRAYEA